MKFQWETTKISIRQSPTIKVFVQNILSDLRDKREFTHHDRLVKGRGVAAHDTQEGENKQTILYTFLLFLAVVGGSVG